jgi:hypothetical protein
MLIQHCTLGYHRANTSGLDTFTNGVGNGIYSNPDMFATPSVTETDFTAAKNAFSAAAADYATYGMTKKSAYIVARKALLDVLDTLADYVDLIAQGDESTIILAGYVPSLAMAQKNVPIEKILFFTTKRTDTVGEIVVEIPAIQKRGNVTYNCVCSEGAPLSNPVLVNGQIKVAATDANVLNDANKSRRKVFSGLTAGVVYYFYVYTSNSVSVSPLSDAKSFMAA